MNSLLVRLLPLLLFVTSVFGATPVGKLKGVALGIEVPDERLQIAGAKVGRSLAEVKAMVARDSSLHVSADNQLLYICKYTPTAKVNGHGPMLKIQTGPNTSTYTGPPPAVNATTAFQLHSRPGATRVLYLDFIGNISRFVNVTNTPPFQLAGTSSPTAQANLDAIRDIWVHVAEDFAAWDIDVTTAAPLPTARGQRCIIGGSNMDWLGIPGVMGVSILGTFGGTIDRLDVPNFVFVDDAIPSDNPGVSNHEITIACVAHEVGHTLGLQHWGETTAGSGSSYTGGHTIAGLTGVSTVCPIMGNSGLPGWPSTCNLNQWSRGGYPFAEAATMSGTQDDLAMISTFATRLTSSTSTLATADTVSGSSITAGGIISSSADVNLMKIHPGPGPLSLTALTQSSYRTRVSNLKVGLSLLDANGITVARNVSVTGMGATLNYTVLTQGDYYIKVVGVGYNPAVTTWTNTGITGTVVGNGLTGFTNYGSLGRYALTGSWTKSSLPVAVPLWTNSAANTRGVPFTAAFDGTGSWSLGGLITTYQWDFGDSHSLPINSTSTLGSPTHTYQAPGNYVVCLTVTDISGAVSSTSKITIPVTGVMPPAHLLVASMTASWINSTNVEDAATVAIQCLNIYGQPARSAAVYINVTGSLKGKAAARADANGMVYITMPKQLKKASVSYTFTVSNITLAGYSYTGAENVISSVTISQNP
jgi:PKD repeat protein